MIVGVGLGQIAGGGGGEAGERVLDHLVVVEGVHDGLAGLDVVPRSLLGVEEHEAGAEAVDDVDLAAGGLELLDGVSGNHLHDERGAFLLSGDASGGVDQDVVVQLLVLGGMIAVVLGVGNHVDGGVGDGLIHPGAGADGLGGHVLLGGRSGDDADDRQTLLQQGEVGNGGLDGNGGVVLLLDGGDGG